MAKKISIEDIERVISSTTQPKQSQSVGVDDILNKYGIKAETQTMQSDPVNDILTKYGISAKQPEIPSDKPNSSGFDFKKGFKDYVNKPNTLGNIYKKYPGFKNMGDVVLHPDSKFTKDQTGKGSIEYFSPEQSEINYPQTKYKYKHPSPGKHAVVYNPDSENEQSIMLDMLHGMTTDKEYSKLRDNFKQSFLSKHEGDLLHDWDAELKENNNDEGDGFESFKENWIDGQIRGLMFEGGESDFKKHNYWIDARKTYLKDKDVNESFSKIVDHLKKTPEPQKSPGLLKGIGSSFAAGSAELAQGVARIPSFAYSGAAMLQNAVSDITGWEWLEAKSPEWLKNNPVAKYYDKQVQAWDESLGGSDMKIIENFQEGNNVEALKNIAYMTARTIPLTISLMAGGYASAGAKTGNLISQTAKTLIPIGGYAGAQKKNQLDTQYPELSEFTKTFNALLSGAGEGLSESMGTINVAKLGRELIEKMGKEQFEKAVKDNVVKTLYKKLGNNIILTGGVAGSVEEMVAGTLENITDKFTIDPDRNIWENVGDQGIVGFFAEGLSSTPLSLANKVARKIEENQFNNQLNEYADLMTSEVINKQTGDIVLAQDRKGQQFHILDGVGETLIVVNKETGERSMVAEKDMEVVEAITPENYKQSIIDQAKQSRSQQNMIQATDEVIEEEEVSAGIKPHKKGDIIDFRGVAMEVQQVSPEVVMASPVDGDPITDAIEIPIEELNAPFDPETKETKTDEIPVEKSFQLGDTELKYYERADGSSFIPVEEGMDINSMMEVIKNEVAKDENGNDLFDVVPITENVPIENAPSWSNNKTKSVTLGISIVPKGNLPGSEVVPEVDSPVIDQAEIKEEKKEITALDTALAVLKDSQGFEDFRSQISDLEWMAVDEKYNPKGELSDEEAYESAINDVMGEKVGKVEVEKVDEYAGLSNKERNGVKFAKDLPGIMDKALEKQKPYRDAFLKRIGLTYDQYTNLPDKRKEVIQNQWTKSSEFKQMESGDAVQPEPKVEKKPEPKKKEEVKKENKESPVKKKKRSTPKRITEVLKSDPHMVSEVEKMRDTDGQPNVPQEYLDKAEKESENEVVDKEIQEWLDYLREFPELAKAIDEFYDEDNNINWGAVKEKYETDRGFFTGFPFNLSEPELIELENLINNEDKREIFTRGIEDSRKANKLLEDNQQDQVGRDEPAGQEVAPEPDVKKESPNYGYTPYEITNNLGVVSGSIGGVFDWVNNKPLEGKEISIGGIYAKEKGKGQGFELLKQVIDYAVKNKIAYIGSTSLNDYARKTFERAEKEGLIKPFLKGLNGKTITWEILSKPEVKKEEPQAKKEPWEMTREELLSKVHSEPLDEKSRNKQWVYGVNTLIGIATTFNKAHEQYLYEQIIQEKPVPEEVLKDYPGLKKEINKFAEESKKFAGDLLKPEAKTPKLTDIQQRELDKSLKEIDEKLSSKRTALEDAKKARDNKFNELRDRNGLFGDVMEQPGKMIDGEFVFTDETVKKALKPFDENIVKAEKDIKELEKLREDTIKSAGQQVAMDFGEQKEVEIKDDKGLIAVVTKDNVNDPEIQQRAAKAYLDALKRDGKMEVTFPQHIAESIEKHTGTKVYYDAESVYLNDPKQPVQPKPSDKKESPKSQLHSDITNLIENSANKARLRVDVTETIYKANNRKALRELLDIPYIKGSEELTKEVYSRINHLDRNEDKESEYIESPKPEKPSSPVNDITTENEHEVTNPKEEVIPTEDNDVLSDNEEGETLDKIQDFGKKIGMARKDTAVRGYKITPNNIPGWARKYTISQNTETKLWKIYIPSGTWMKVLKDGFKTSEEAYEALPLVAVSQNHRVYSDRNGKFGIYRKWSSGKQWEVQSGFETRDDALRFMAENAVDIINKKSPVIDRPHLDKISRKRKDWRNGKNVTPEQFLETFGFRGGEFGNWLASDERQSVLNMAYDAFMDMSEILGVPPKALSFNGELSIGFGSRGHGLQGAAAHYEPNRAVINLTRINGAGSLAHEWFHAFDNYLAKLDGKISSERQEDGTFKTADRKMAYFSHGESISPKTKVRDELLTAFKDVMNEITTREVVKDYDIPKIEKQISSAKEYFEQAIKEVRDSGWSAITKERQYGSKKKPATTEQLKRFDELVDEIRKGNYGKDTWYPSPKSKFNGKWMYEIEKELSDLVKDIIGKAPRSNDDNRGFLYSEINRIKRAEDQLTKAKAEGKYNVRINSEFLSESKSMDESKSGSYWSTPHEMSARAFEAFLEDETLRSGESQYLVYGARNMFYALMGVKPYPEGQERVKINSAFRKLFDVIETRQEGERVAMLRRNTISDGTDSRRSESEDNTQFRLIGNPLTKPKTAGELLNKHGISNTQIKNIGNKLRVLAIKSGARVNVINRQSQLPESLKKLIGEQILPGVYWGGVSYIILENMSSEGEAIRTFIHEVGVHGGIRKLIPDAEVRKELFERIVDDIGLEEIAKYVHKDYIEAYKAGNLTKEALGEEYMAYIAEKRLNADSVLTKKEQTWWEKFIKTINETLNKIFNFDVKITEQDVLNIAAAAIQSNLQNGQSNTSNGREVYRDSRETPQDNNTQEPTRPGLRFAGELLDQPKMKIIGEKGAQDNLGEARSEISPDYKNLEKENKSTWPKIPTEKIFSEYEQVLPLEKRKEADKFMDKLNQVPVQSVPASSIIATQRYLTIKNLKEVKDITESPYLLKDGDNYYVLDGHHRIANDILSGKDVIESHVFDATPESSDLRLRLSEKDESIQKQFEAEKEVKEKLVTGLNTYRKWLSDRDIAVELFQKEVIKAGGKVTDMSDVALHLNLYNSRKQNKQNEFNKKQLKPLLETLKELKRAAKAPFSDIYYYMRAKHGPERNLNIAQKERDRIEEVYQDKAAKLSPKDEEYEVKSNKLIKERNNKLAALEKKVNEDDNYSGFATDKANKVIEAFESKVNNKKLIDKFWEQINGMTNYHLDELLDGGLISKELHERLKAQYQYYVPLKGWNREGDPEFDYVQDISSILSSPIKTAGGRKTLSDNPLPYIVNAAYSAIVQNEKNRVKTSALRLITNNKELFAEKGLGGIRKTYIVQMGFNEDGSVKEVEYDSPPPQEFFDEGKVRTKNNTPFPYEVQRSKYEAQAHEIEVYANGQKAIIWFSKDDPAMANAVNRKTPKNIEAANAAFQKFPGAITRFMAGNFTVRSLNFVFGNLMRDLPLSTVSNYIDNGAEGGLKFLAQTVNIQPTLRREMQGKLDPTNKIDNYMKLFMEGGGRTGFSYLQDIKAVEKSIKWTLRKEEFLDNAGIMRVPITALPKLIEGIEMLAGWSEDVSRFATYVAERELGKTHMQALKASKNVSVNFDKKGELSGTLGSFYAFFNATIRAVTKYGQMWEKAPYKMGGIHAYLMAQGFIMAMLYDMFGGLDDDDEEKKYDNISDYKKLMYLNIPIIDVSIPMPHILRVPHSFGVAAYEVYSGRREMMEAMKQVGGMALGEFSPIQPDGFIGSDGDFSAMPIAPTAFKPVFELLANENFMGMPVFREMYTKKLELETAEAAKHFKRVGPGFKAMTKALYMTGGGNEHYDKFIWKGKENVRINPIWDWNPAKIEHFYNNYLGGPAKLFNQTAKMVEMTVDATNIYLQDKDIKKALDEFDSRHMPVIYQFKVNTYGSVSERFWYDQMETMSVYESNLSKSKKRMEFENMGEMYESPIHVKYEQYRVAKKLVSMYKEIMENSGGITTDEYKQAEKEMQNVMKQYKKQAESLEAELQ